MKQLNINKQIIILAILPALIISTTLTAYFMLTQFSYISDALDRHGRFIVKQLSPAAEYTLYSGNTEIIKPVIETVIKNNAVLHIEILDRDKNIILDVSKPEEKNTKERSLLSRLLESKKEIVFIEPVISAQLSLDDHANESTTVERSKNVVIGNIKVTLTTRYAVDEKINHIKNGAFITLTVLLVAIFIIIRRSRSLTAPIKYLTNTVRKIASGDFDARIERNVMGEIGVLQSCINRMAEELKHSQSDMENQLNEYTHELQQTMEELEIRNAELDITRSKAIYANNAKSEFLANMSHELRTPLSGIIGFTELLQGTQLSEQQKDYSDTIKKSAKNLLEIINDILDLSKIESGKTEITTSEFNLIDIIEDIINLLSPSALEKNIELFYRIDKDIPMVIHSDPFRIHQILTNLIGNAIKFTNEGYVYLQVTMGHIDNAETSLKFTVIDTGIGMNKDDKKKLFQAFTQADTSITRRFGGTGLGLVISRKLTLLMHGEISFDSTEGEGSTFWFSVPVTPVAVEYKPSELSNKKIAFVCNHLIARDSFRTLFNNFDCTVNDYAIDDLQNLSEIQDNNDIIIVFLSCKDLNNHSTLVKITDISFSKPSLLIASTRSHTKLKSLQRHVFDSAVFTSEKISQIKQKLINSTNKKSDESEESQTSNLVSTIHWNNVKVMVVDDNEINLRLAEILLSNHKARVTTARSGAQAVDFASINSFDIIFMDLHMPGIDGYEATKKIREITPGKQPVIIALTANALPLEREKVIQSGMNGILIKPVSDIILQKVISQWVLKKPINMPDFNEFKTDNLHTDALNTDNRQVFSIELAKEFTGNNEALAYELFGMLQAELETYRTGIIAALNNNNLVELRAQAHKLHGASRCCGTTELKEASSHIERLIDKKINFDIDKETSLLLNAIKNAADYKIDSHH